MGLLNKGLGAKLAWFGANIATTLTVVTVAVTTGPLSAQPIPGSSGIPGVTGPIGSSGVPGPQGEIGSSGIQGIPGTPGAPGADGDDGVDGIDGIDGVDGIDGKDRSNVYPLQRLAVPPAPTGDARSTYAQSLVSQGYIPLSSVEDFSIFTDHPSELAGTFGNMEAYFRANRYVLTADIDFADANLDVLSNRIIGFNNDQNNDQDSLYFQGTFDGAGFSIKNFENAQTNSDHPAAFIPYTGGGAVIRNVTFDNLSVSSVNANNDYGDIAAGVVGYVDGPTVLENITIKNSEVVGTDEAGGVVGVVNDNIYLINVHNLNTSVFATDNAGGLIGTTDEDSSIYHVWIQDSSNSGTLDSRNLDPDFDNFLDYTFAGEQHAGGLIGSIDENESVVILNSYNVGTIVSEEGEAGGLVASLAKSDLTVIANSYNAGFVLALSEDGGETGGFVGDLRSTEKIFIQNSFNVGHIHSYESAVGGFIGELGGSSNETTTATTYITNSYNAGYISTHEFFDSEKGGLIGQVNNDRHVMISDSFNVGSFSISITELISPRYLSRNGAIIGDPEGNVALDNVAFYVDETKPANYLNHAMQDLHPLLAQRITNRSKFETSEFMYQSIWDMTTVWMFPSQGFAFPILREVIFIQANDPFLFDVEFTDELEVYGLQVVYEALINEYVMIIDEYYAWVRDVETSLINMEVSLYAAIGSGLDIQTVMATGDVFTFESRDAEYFEDLRLLPTQGDGRYVLYLVVKDSQGNYAMQESGEFIDYVTVANNLAPSPGNSGVMIVDVIGNNPDLLEVFFNQGTDDIFDANRLSYYFVLATNGFDFAAYNPLTGNNSQGLLYVTFIDANNFITLDIDLLNLASGTYQATVYVSDGLAYSRYVVIDVVMP